MSVTALSGKDACGKDDCLTEEAIRVEKGNIWYRPWGPNSNSFVRHLLGACGIAKVKPNVSAPGWDVDLNTPPSNPSRGSHPRPRPASRAAAPKT